MAVGDSETLVRSRERLDSLIEHGSAALLVSHDLELLRPRATRVLWLHEGRLVMDGDPADVVGAYEDREHTDAVLTE
jgi:teichoic acid transport system ATP-binding protein